MDKRQLALSIIVLACAAASLSARVPVIAQAVSVLAFDQPVQGQITRDVFRQVYTFNGHGGDVIGLTLAAVLATGSSALDPLLIVTDEQNTIIARDDDSGKRYDATIASLTLPRDGSYFVIATRFGQERGSTTGSYTLILSHAGVSVNNGSTTSVLHYADNLVDQIGDAGNAPEKVFTFSAQRGDLISVTMQRISGDLDPFLILADTQGNVLALNDDDPNSSGTLDAAIREWLIRKTGDYLIVATRFGRASGTSRGSFSLAIDRVPPADLGKRAARAILIDYGSSQSGTITNDTLQRYYQFEARKGDVITLDVERTTGNLDPTLTLFSTDTSANPNLKKISDADQGQRGQSARLSAFSAPQDATYVVVIGRYSADKGFTAGGYTLSLIGRQGVTVGPRGILLLSYGGAVTSSVDTSNPNQEYVFQGKAGDVISIMMQATSGDLQPDVLLFDATRHLLTQNDAQTDAQSDSAQIANYKLPASGAYVIIASRHGRANGKTSGTYLLTLTK